MAGLFDVMHKLDALQNQRQAFSPYLHPSACGSGLVSFHSGQCRLTKYHYANLIHAEHAAGSMLMLSLISKVQIGLLLL